MSGCSGNHQSPLSSKSSNSVYDGFAMSKVLHAERPASPAAPRNLPRQRRRASRRLVNAMVILPFQVAIQFDKFFVILQQIIYIFLIKWH